MSWTASAGSPTPTGYFVTRIRTSDSATSAACGTSAGALTTSATCTDLAVPNGTYRYAVTAVYRSWTATSALSNTVTVAVVTATATTTTLSSSSNPSVVGQTVTYTATVTPSGVDRDGHVQGRRGEHHLHRWLPDAQRLVRPPARSPTTRLGRTRSPRSTTATRPT